MRKKVTVSVPKEKEVFFCDQCGVEIGEFLDCNLVAFTLRILAPNGPVEEKWNHLCTDCYCKSPIREYLGKLAPPE